MNTWKKIFGSSLAIVGLGFSVNCLANDLISVYQQALESDPTFKAAGKERLSQHQNVPISRAALLPFMTASANALRNWQDIDTRPRLAGAIPAANLGLGNFTFDSHNITVDLQQQIFNYGSWMQFFQAKTSVKAADATYAAAAQNLMSRVATAYFNVLNAEDDLRFTQAEKRAVWRQLDQVTQQYKVGLVAITGVYQAQAQYDSIIAQEIAAKNNIVNAKEDLRAITGIFYKELDGLKTKVPLVKPTPIDVEEWVKSGREHNWTLLSARYSSETLKQEISVQRSGHFPVLNAIAQHAHNKTDSGSPGGKVDTKNNYAGVALDLPIFEGWLVTSLTKKAVYDYEESKDQVEETQRSVDNLARQSYNNVINGISKIKADRQAIISNESSLRSTIEAYKVGTQTMLDVLQSQRELFDTQRIYARDQYDYINATIALKEAAGILSIRDLIEINEWMTHSKKSYSAILAKNIGRFEEEAQESTPTPDEMYDPFDDALSDEDGVPDDLTVEKIISEAKGEAQAKPETYKPPVEKSKTPAKATKSESAQDQTATESAKQPKDTRGDFDLEKILNESHNNHIQEKVQQASKNDKKAIKRRKKLIAERKFSSMHNLVK